MRRRPFRFERKFCILVGAMAVAVGVGVLSAYILPPWLLVAVLCVFIVAAGLLLIRPF